MISLSGAHRSSRISRGTSSSHEGDEEISASSDKVEERVSEGERSIGLSSRDLSHVNMGLRFLDRARMKSHIPSSGCPDTG